MHLVGRGDSKWSSHPPQHTVGDFSEELQLSVVSRSRIGRKRRQRRTITALMYGYGLSMASFVNPTSSLPKQPHEACPVSLRLRGKRL
jgi:hypothetical protein